MVYLDNAATTRPYTRVVQSVSECLTESFGNPSSVHLPGIKAKKTVNQARQTLASIFQVPLPGIVFCSSGTESDNLALKGVMGTTQGYQGRLITTPLEHSAVTNTALWLEQKGCQVEFVRINPQSGQVDIDHLLKLMETDTKLVSIQHVNSETGIIQDLSSISKAIKARNPKTLFHADGVQAFGKFHVDLNQLGVDFYSISAHKFHGIKGAGALILRQKYQIETLIHGGGQESKLRSGTENVAAISAMSLAAKMTTQEIKSNHLKVESFSKWFKESIKSTFPNIRIFEAPDTVPHIISLSIPGILGEILLHHLAEKSVYISTGSACNATSKKLSPVLQSLQFTRQSIMETIRISLSAKEIPEEPELFFRKFSQTVEELLGMS